MSAHVGALAAGALLLAILGLVGVSAAQGGFPWQAAVCGDPNSWCWTHGRPIYTAIIRRDMNGDGNGHGVATITLLNTGPNMPDLVAVIAPHGGGSVVRTAATINTGEGSRATRVNRVGDSPQRYVWSLGPVPDGAVVTIKTEFRYAQADISWTQADLFAGLWKHRLPVHRVAFDRAQLRG
jgi:hypothetical protein